jgi:hypothetical protein
MYRWLLYLGVMLLAGCQSNALLRDYDPGRDFSAYRTWQWQEPPLRYQPDDPRLNNDLSNQRIREALAQALEARGLRQAAPGESADLRVQVWLMLDTRYQQLHSHYGYYDAWGDPWYGWGGPVLQQTRTLEYQVRTLQIDLYDGRDNRLVWRAGREDAPEQGNAPPARRRAAIQHSVDQMLQYFPPH